MKIYNYIKNYKIKTKKCKMLKWRKTINYNKKIKKFKI